MKTNSFIVPMAIAGFALMTAGTPDVWATGKGYTWIGADGGAWEDATNWDDGTGQSTGHPTSTDFAQFTNFSGTVTGSPEAQILDIGPGSDLTLDGSGSFDQINVGQDFDFNTGDASLTVVSGGNVTATLLNLGSTLGGSGTLTVQGSGVFTTTGGIVMDQAGDACNIIATGGGKVLDGVSLTMAAGGLIQVDPPSQVVIGDSGGGGTFGAVTITDGHFFEGEGSITGNVRVDGNLETFNAGWPANNLTITGNVIGSGTISVVQELDINGSIGPDVTISLLGNGDSNKGLLRLAQPPLDAGSLDTMSAGSVIALDALVYDTVSWSDADGLTLPGPSATLNLATTGDHSHQSFSVEPDPISGTDIIIGDSTVGPSPDLFDVASREVTIPTLEIGLATYTNVVAKVDQIVTPPSGSSPNGSADTYNPATNQLTVQTVNVGAATYYNAVVTLSGLESIGSVGGADSYDPVHNQLTIHSVQVLGGLAYRNVVVTVGSIQGFTGGMPAFSQDQYTPSSNELQIPAVQANGRVYTNVLITVAGVVSVGP